MPDQTKHLHEFDCPHCGEVHSYSDLKEHQHRSRRSADKPNFSIGCKGCEKHFEVTPDRMDDMYRMSLR